MPTVVVSTKIGAPPEVVTKVLLDARLAPKWTSGLERLEVVEGRPGEVGCVGAAHYVEGRRRYILRDELLEVIPDRFFRSRVTGGGIDVEVETTLEPVGDSATRLSLHWVGRGTALASKLLLPFTTRRIARRADEDLAALRRIAESQAE